MVASPQSFKQYGPYLECFKNKIVDADDAEEQLGSASAKPVVDKKSHKFLFFLK